MKGKNTELEAQNIQLIKQASQRRSQMVQTDLAAGGSEEEIGKLKADLESKEQMLKKVNLDLESKEQKIEKANSDLKKERESKTENAKKMLGLVKEKQDLLNAREKDL